VSLFYYGTVFARIGGAEDHHGDTAGTVALIGHLFEVCAFEFAGTALNIAFDIIGRHRVLPCGLDRHAESGVGGGVAAAAFRRHDDFSGEFGKEFAAHGVLFAFFVTIVHCTTGMGWRQEQALPGEKDGRFRYMRL